MRYPVKVTKDTNGTVLVSFVDLPAHSIGEDEDEALLSAIDALETAVSGYMARRVEVPEPGAPKRGQRLVDVRHGSRFEAMEQAARAIGKRLEIRVA